MRDVIKEREDGERLVHSYDIHNAIGLKMMMSFDRGHPGGKMLTLFRG